MDESAIAQFVANTFSGVEVVAAPNGDRFFFYDPERNTPHDRRMPFATIVSGDDYDTASNLSRPGVFRLNIGVAKETYRAMFGPPPTFAKDGGVVDTGHDYAALDRVMPHPVYAAMSWVCVLNPSKETFREKVVPLLREAYKTAERKHVKRAGKGGA